MYGIEEELFKQMVFLKELYGLEGIKAEFEAEGSGFNDLVRLRRLTEKAGVRLFLKIGGVEAVRDIRDSLELGVDGLIAPMVESAFGLEKFLSAYESVYGRHRIRLAINVETSGAIGQLGAILDLATRVIDGVTLGRTDLSASYMDEEVVPDCELVDSLVMSVGKAAKMRGLGFTVGGGVSGRTVERYGRMPELASLVDCMETRKVVLPTRSMLDGGEALNEALRLEELYILSKKQISDAMLRPELERLEKLRRRAARPVPEAETNVA